MFPSKAFLSLVFLTLSLADANILSRDSHETILRIAAKISGPNQNANIAEKDRTRIRTMIQAGRAASIEIVNSAVAYSAQVGVGTPPTYYTLMVDTGSSNTWVGGNKSYILTNSSHDTGNNVTVVYGHGNFTGEEWTDTVTLSPTLVIKDQSIGVANSSTGFDEFDGILGIGPTDRTAGTVNNTTLVPTVTDNLYARGMISKEVIGVYLVPVSEPSNDGEVTFGGYNGGVITDSVEYVPLTMTSPSSEFWGINQTISYGAETILADAAGIVDTGTTLIWVATDAFQKYQKLTGGTMDSLTGLLTITLDQYYKLKPLLFHIGNRTYELTPNAQIWPRSLNPQIGGVFGKIYLTLADLGIVPNVPNFGFVNGYCFLEHFYSVYDTTNRRVGFAPTRHTYANLN